MALPDANARPAEEQYLNCIRCGLCLSVCPTYREILTETASPRGRVALARKSLQGELAPTANLYEQMYACLDCLACNEICPVGIRPANLALDMRRVQEQRRPKFWKKTVFEQLVPDPEKLEAASGPFRWYERSGIRRAAHALDCRNVAAQVARYGVHAAAASVPTAAGGRCRR